MNAQVTLDSTLYRSFPCPTTPLLLSRAELEAALLALAVDCPGANSGNALAFPAGKIPSSLLYLCCASNCANSLALRRQS